MCSAIVLAKQCEKKNLLTLLLFLETSSAPPTMTTLTMKLTTMLTMKLTTMLTMMTTMLTMKLTMKLTTMLTMELTLTRSLSETRPISDRETILFQDWILNASTSEGSLLLWHPYPAAGYWFCRCAGELLIFAILFVDHTRWMSLTT
jgi:hypothetical protein